MLADTIETIRAVRSDVLSDRDDLGTRGGSVRVVSWAIAASVTGLEDLGRLVAAIIDELHRRAALCDQYTAELQRHAAAHRRWVAAVGEYRTRVDTDHPTRWPGPEPTAPAAPFPGATAG